MSRRMPKVAVHLYEDELGRMASLLSPEAAGYLLRILDLQHRTGAGLPDDKSTHLVLGLQKRRWVLIRAELLRLMEIRDGKITYTAMLDRFSSQREKRANRNPAARAATPKADAPKDATRPQPKIVRPKDATPASDPAHDPKTPLKATGRFADNGEISFDAPPRKKSSLDASVHTPTSPFEVMDRALEKAPDPNVIPLDSARRERQPKLPGMAASTASAQGDLDHLPNPKKLAFDLGITLLVRCNGLKEPEARRRIGKLLSEYDAEYVYAVIAQTIQQKDNVVDPWSWMVRCIKKFPDKATAKAARMQELKTGKKAPTQQPKVKPKATPQFMGISTAKADRLRQRSAAIRAKGQTGGLPTPANQDQPAHDTDAGSAELGGPISAPIAL